MGSETIHIKKAAKLIGIAPVTLKRWLLQGKISKVKKNRNGWWTFTLADIERIKSFARATAEESKSRSAKYKVASFFSGIGGFDLGFEKHNFQISFQCEIEPFCQKVLKQHWPETPFWEDITTLENAEIPFFRRLGRRLPVPRPISCKNGETTRT